MKGPAARRRERLRRGAYLVPSLFTIGNAFLGFYAVVRGLRGQFEAGGLLIFAAAVLDGLDGSVARLTGTASDFGREFDSLADVLTFGAAPALLAVLWLRDDFGRVGWLVPLFYLVCAATRLARFNVQAKTLDSRYFVGLPSPAAAGAVAAVFLLPSAGPGAASAALLALLIACGGLMVSTFRYVSVKKIDLRRRWSYRAAIPLAALLLALAYRPRVSLVAAAIAYALSGPVVWAATRAGRGSREAPSAGGAAGEEPPAAGIEPRQEGPA